MDYRIKKDKLSLIEYYKNYSLRQTMEDETISVKFSFIHKKIYAYLVLVSEVDYQNERLKDIKNIPLEYLEESVSDILESFFAWTNGAYKAADLLLRSSIENFLKFAIGNEEDQVFREKNVYKIFEMANKMEQFNQVITRAKISTILYSVYGELCKTTHTATFSNMEHLASLDALPKWNSKKAQDFSDNLEKVINAFLAFFLANNKRYIDGMYRNNQDIFYEAIPQRMINLIEQKRRENRR